MQSSVKKRRIIILPSFRTPSYFPSSRGSEAPVESRKTTLLKETILFLEAPSGFLFPGSLRAQAPSGGPRNLYSIFSKLGGIKIQPKNTKRSTETLSPSSIQLFKIQWSLMSELQKKLSQLNDPRTT